MRLSGWVACCQGVNWRLWTKDWWAVFSANEWSVMRGVDGKPKAEWTTGAGAENYGLCTRGTTDRYGTVSGGTPIEV